MFSKGSASDTVVLGWAEWVRTAGCSESSLLSEFQPLRVEGPNPHRCSRADWAFSDRFSTVARHSPASLANSLVFLQASGHWASFTALMLPMVPLQN
jgi:hypothetical protein